MKSIILCADDYGQNASVSQAIVDLFEQKRLSATSCMSTAPSWPGTVKLLEPFKNKVDIGLHLNLTEGKPLSKAMTKFLPLRDLIIKTHTKKIEKATILTELRAQLDNFTENFGALPDFIDGHHHVHQLPIIRDAVFELYEEKLRENSTYVRCTFDPASLLRVRDVAYLKQLIIQLLGGIYFKKELEKRKVLHNKSFAGIYNFAESYEYSELFPRFLKQVGNGGIIMCHPGLMSKEEDEIAASRHNEYLYFSSNAFTRDCNKAPVTLVRFREVAHK
ncbi:MAG: ChbG/HpnK family deacetylase [Pseudomonadota bacterium]